jgi:hypothetical protein
VHFRAPQEALSTVEGACTLLRHFLAENMLQDRSGTNLEPIIQRVGSGHIFTFPAPGSMIGLIEELAVYVGRRILVCAMPVLVSRRPDPLGS